MDDGEYVRVKRKDLETLIEISEKFLGIKA